MASMGGATNTSSHLGPNTARVSPGVVLEADPHALITYDGGAGLPPGYWIDMGAHIAICNIGNGMGSSEELEGKRKKRINIS